MTSIVQTQTVQQAEQIMTIGQKMSENMPVYFLLAFTALLVIILYAFKMLWERTTKLLDGIMTDIKKVADTNEKLSLYIVKDMASIKEKVNGLSEGVSNVNRALMSSLDLKINNHKDKDES